MRYLISFFILVFTSYNLMAQDTKKEKKSINDFNFESVTNPAFLLLDETPTAINTPDNLKSLAVYISNGFSNGNIALEINPYWIFGGQKDKSYKDYRGIKKDVINPFKAMETNSTFSLGYIEKEFEGFDDKKKAFAFGLRTTLFEYYGKKRTEKVVDIIDVVDKAYSNDALSKYDKDLRGRRPRIKIPNADLCQKYVDNKNNIPAKYKTAAGEFLNANPQYRSKYPNANDLVTAYFDETSKKVLDFFFNPKNVKPVIRLDGAIAYSVLFKENEINTNTTNRLGSWLTLDVAIQFNKKQYLHVFAIGKYIDDGFNIDENQNYFNKNFWDYGGKIELDLNKFKFSYEYLERDGSGEQFRSVGNITYQISEKMSITGGFGKDFPKDDNLVSLLGINWGLDLGEKSFSKD